MIMYEATATKESLKISNMSMYDIYVLCIFRNNVYKIIENKPFNRNKRITVKLQKC